MNDYGIRLERRDHIAVISLDRPQRRNAFDEIMWKSLAGVTEKLKQDLPRVIIITGAGDNAFCAGFDVNPDNPQVSRLASAVENRDSSPVRDLIRMIRTTLDSLVFLPVPVIAAINGLAYGGGAEIAVRCDLRVMDPAAILCFSEVTLGLMPDHGGVVGLARLVGPSIAADLILTARKLDAEEALALGLVNRISGPGSALDEAISLATSIADNGPRAVRHALEVIRKTADMTYVDALEMESKKAVELIASGECIHGITAFLTKEKPNFPEPD
ncbi:MAG TPA: enoyl-CoA hydratase/isomerase family protein [Deltaproteobacteria bacterium]|nr:enoyl-CoA hydratase/isomerase family protein [Deltaproteobacteria bacterium]